MKSIFKVEQYRDGGLHVQYETHPGCPTSEFVPHIIYALAQCLDDGMVNGNKRDAARVVMLEAIEVFERVLTGEHNYGPKEHNEKEKETDNDCECNNCDSDGCDCRGTDDTES